jgi:flagellar biosynthetic protein FliQ
MNDIGAVILIAQGALLIALKVSMPVLAFGMLAGFLIGIFQTVTQLQDSTLAFVPKLLATLVSLAVFGPWMLHTLTRYSSELLSMIPYIWR